MVKNSQFNFFKSKLNYKDRVIHMPNMQQMATNAAAVKKKYGLSNAICGIDGTHCAFDGKPRYEVVNPLPPKIYCSRLFLCTGFQKGFMNKL